MFLIFLAGTGETTTNEEIAANRASFLENYGPESAHRIAFTRDGEGTLQVTFSYEGGTVRDGGTEVIQAVMLQTEGDKKSFLLTAQNPTDKLGVITDDEQALIGTFFTEVYFSGKRKDVVLVAKSDKELDANTMTTYFASTDDGFNAKDVGDIDYVRIDDKETLVFAKGKVATIDTDRLDKNLEKGDVDGAMMDAKKISIVGQETKLARGPKIQIGDAQIETVAYVKTEPDGKTKMIVLDRDTHQELKVQAFDGNYAMADHGGNVVYLLSTLPGGQDIDDIVTVTPKPTVEFLAEQPSA